MISKSIYSHNYHVHQWFQNIWVVLCLLKDGKNIADVLRNMQEHGKTFWIFPLIWELLIYEIQIYEYNPTNSSYQIFRYDTPRSFLFLSQCRNIARSWDMKGHGTCVMIKKMLPPPPLQDELQVTHSVSLLNRHLIMEAHFGGSLWRFVVAVRCGGTLWRYNLRRRRPYDLYI